MPTACLQAAEQGVKVTWHHHDDDDDWADVMEDLEDPWMRNPAGTHQSDTSMTASHTPPKAGGFKTPPGHTLSVLDGSPLQNLALPVLYCLSLYQTVLS